MNPDLAGRTVLFECQVDQEPASKANQRRLVMWGKRPASIKSEKALRFAQAVRADATPLPAPLTQDVLVDITIFYRTRRPDLDESLILDTLQGIAYVNDRQVKKKIVSWGLDRDFPKVIVKIYALQEGDVPGDQGRGLRLREREARRRKMARLRGLPEDMSPG